MGRRKSQPIGGIKNKPVCPENSREERKTDEGGETGDMGKSCRPRGRAVDRLKTG